jgi:hypothetical protein
VEVIALQVFVSLTLVVGSLLLFAFSAKQRDHEHSSRLALLPLESDRERDPEKRPRGPKPPSRSDDRDA